jgi:hypothetical protein
MRPGGEIRYFNVFERLRLHMTGTLARGDIVSRVGMGEGGGERKGLAPPAGLALYHGSSAR